jgi:hypothetical protein
MPTTVRHARHTWDCVDLLDPPGPLWLMVDFLETRRGSDSYAPTPCGWPFGTDWTGQLIHLISDFAGGEIRAYILIDGEIYHRYPAPDPWPEMDVLVCRALQVSVPERMPDARVLAPTAVRLVPEGTGYRIDVGLL